MLSLINNRTKFKITYAMLFLIISMVISFISGFDFRAFIYDHPEFIVDSYSELLIAFVLSLSGIIALINKDVRMHPFACAALCLVQIWCYFYCESHEVAAHLSVIKWIPLCLSLFTLLLNDSEDSMYYKSSNCVSNHQSVLVSFIIVITGIVLVLSGIESYCRCGVLFAEFMVEHVVSLFALYAIVSSLLIFDGVYLLFICKRIRSCKLLFPVAASLAVTGIYLLFQYKSDKTSLVYFTSIMLISSVLIIVAWRVDIRRNPNDTHNA